ncbi:MAG: hypothetical protein KAI72_00820 [Candidatus Pacebacteria bacterium]|nr:hypothetical protein [Candidatus Paceibacterota bacterium]
MDIKSFLHELEKREGTLNRIKEWKKRAEGETNEINRFIFRWIAFNGLYFASYEMDYGQRKAEQKYEHILISEFCKKFILTDKTLASKIDSNDVERVFKNKIKDKSGYMGTSLVNMETAESTEEKICNMVMVAYKIRCRLFHGEKNPNLEINEEVCEAADKVIASVLDHVIVEE